MRVTVLGAGPAGLYLAILLAPAHEVVVIERNPPGATFGFGVVFSEETLGRLRDADEPTYEEIQDAFATWTTIDVRHRGEVIRSRGHSFSAIRRTTLLDILQRRARELGVELRFEQEIREPAELPPADLTVAADGVNSLLRRHGAFGPRIRVYPTRFAWFGTDLALDAFTFAFAPTEHGLFQAHAYPFDAGTSTFIVETREATWRRAGLDERSEEESLAFCQELFADTLGGHRLLSNRSVWLAFNEVRNAHWSDGATVLIGDAAHTAHFSIGSGTKLAMEDAIELGDALSRHDVGPALVEYELERKPVVERFQEAARRSAEYFENVPMDLEPLQFAFNLLTRSGRIGHANLTIRDPQLVRRVDARVGGVPLAPPPLFAPLELDGVRLRNRVAVEGVESRGAGLVITPLVAVMPEGRITPEDPPMPEPAPGAATMLALNHAGRRGACRPRSEGVDLPLREGAWPLVAPAPIPYTPRSQTPSPPTPPDEDRIRDAFVAAARAGEAFDILELNLGQGYLLGSYLSPLTNPGGDTSFPLRVVEAVRAVWEGPLAARLSVTDWARGGIELEQAVRIAATLRDLGVILIHVAGGQTTAESAPEYRRGHLTALGDRIRAEAKVRTLVGGYLDTLDAVNTIVGAGRSDLCLLEPAALIE
jgi:anthraniloyl-CoA monooxygenase